jgi:GNAT superfamily N-acetyltransferase
MIAFRLRATRLPDDAPLLRRFIAELQAYEKGFEPDRRTDDAVAAEFLAVLLDRVAKRNGAAFIAETEAGETLGWAAAHESENDIYVERDERTFGWISELYVVESARGLGVGRALIEACEDWARKRGLRVIMIGALAGNARALEVYRAAGYAPYATDLRKYLK